MNGLPARSEHSTQAGFFQEASYEFRNDETFKPALFYAVLNGAWIAGGDGSEENKIQNRKRKGGLIAKYKREGWKKGVADLHYDQPRGPFTKLVIEFKKEGKRTEKARGVFTGGLSPEQVDYLQAIRPYARIVIAYTVEQALEAFREYMSLEEANLGNTDDYIKRLVINNREDGKILDKITESNQAAAQAFGVPPELIKG